ncbi:hypothetical protein RCOM_0187870 [Ricinus communis]|uniref:DUF7795 domain-containing protein n=1 Tax=Ricinus communis TaxID=3988 RepID=B9SSD0_RICCO|nr:hypothetical protein RCOM_0187870 [Ricinus communis]
MGTKEETKLKTELQGIVLQTFTQFSTRIAKNEELGAVGSRLLSGFQQELGKLTQYKEWNFNVLIFLSFPIFAFICLAKRFFCTSSEPLHIMIKIYVKNLINKQLFDQEEMSPSALQESEVTDYAALMGIIYNMVKQDYVMQERIVTSLNLKSLPGELESYCLM